MTSVTKACKGIETCASDRNAIDIGRRKIPPAGRLQYVLLDEKGKCQLHFDTIPK